MKFYETHFDEYVNKSENANLHPELECVHSKLPNTINQLSNLIFYGPSGVGKYTQMLTSIKKYSACDLKYEKKICVNFNKTVYFLKISDIHYEIDMSLLGCNSKLLWHDIYLQIIDIISAKPNKIGIIVCKNFHEIHSELLEIFYSYMQLDRSNKIVIKFIIITQEVSFIPDTILNSCKIINVCRPSKKLYNDCLHVSVPKAKIGNITNIKNIHLTDTDKDNIDYKIICNKIIAHINDYQTIQFMNFRDILYDIFIYNFNITECVWYIMTSLIQHNQLKKEQITEMLIKTYCFFKYYNNNYRPIYHLENYLLTIIKIIYNL
jgi:DNA polymerase III delta prime subunit